MLYGAQDDGKPVTSDEDILKEANERWQACKEWQGTEDERSREDTKFANGDARNTWQWPDKIYAQRTGGESELPTLTINKTRSHNDIIINEMSKTGSGIKVRPTAGGASYKSAKVMMSIFRRIENISKASTQYRKVAEQQVDGGIGYILIETRFTSNRSRNQDIYLRAPRDPTGVYLDPWIKEADGSDANFGFEFERMPRKEFARKYPKWKGKVGTSPLQGMEAWLSDKEIMLCRYHRKVQKPDTYVWYKESEDGPEVEMLLSEIKDDAGKEITKALLAQIKDGTIEGGTREVFDDQVKWYLIAGDTIIDRGDWAGKYIPICRCVGREVVIDATLDRKGHTRLMIDPQRMLNYANSCSVQGVASQVKSSWLAPARAVEGQEQWKSANINNFAVLLYNDVEEEAPEALAKIEPPQRIEPPKPSPGWLQVGQDAERHMMMVSGQYQAQLGENDTQSAASGKAINERKEQGDTATYHFPERMGDMKRFIGTQLLDLIPKIYDSKRALHIEDDAGEKSWIMIDPNQQEVIQELKQLKEDEEAAKIAFNPSIGEYECVSDPGPDFATQREETFNAMSQILQANKELVAVIGDIFFKNSDFAGAEELAERLMKEIKATKPYLFDDSADPQVAALQEQLKQMVATNSELITKLADEKLKVRGRDEKRDIEALNADTKRMEAITNAQTKRMQVTIDAMSKLLLTPQQREQMEHEIGMASQQMEHEITKATHDHVFGLIQQANQADIDAQNEPAEQS
jgi:hypothetical protein